MLFDLKDGKKYCVICATQIPAGKIPDEIQVVPFGHWKGFTDGEGETVEFEVTPELAKLALKYHDEFDRRYPERDLPIDYEHQTLKGGEAPAAGWYKKLFLKNNGIYTRPKSWSDKAKAYLLNKEYRYHSPVLLFNDVDGETKERIPLWISSIALTNSPFLNGIKPIVAKNGEEPRTIIYLSNTVQQPNTGGNTMLEKILALFGLDPTATFDTVAAKFNAMKDGATAIAAKYTAAMKELGLKEDASADDVKAFALKHTTILQELGVKTTDTIDHIKSVIVAAKTPGTQQLDLKDYVKKSELETVQLALKTRDVNDAITAAVSKGKIAPAALDNYKKIALKDLTEFNDLMAKIPDYSAVPLQEIDAKDVIANSATDPSANTQVVEIAAKAGVSKEDLKKFGGK